MDSPKDVKILLQNQLNLLANALEQRNPAVSKYRRGLTKIMLGIEHAESTAIEKLERQIEENNNRNKTSNKIRGRHIELQEMLQELNSGPRAKTIAAKQLELASLKSQIAELEKQSAALEDEIQASISVQTLRSNRIEKAIKELPPLESLEVDQKQEQNLKATLEQKVKEREAARQGAELWANCAELLERLNVQISQSQLSEYGELLAKCVAQLNHCLSIATAENWGPLVVAIQQELEVLRAASSAAQWVQSEQQE